jgi:inhibitor of KinA sporulation pathway (predicted exonuclease)
MPKNLAEICVVDIEATCWDGYTPPPGQSPEVIEIGVARVSLASMTVERLWPEPLYVIPMVSRVSEFCERLTGISQRTLDERAVPFACAIARIQEAWPQLGRCTWASWGDYDRIMLAGTARALARTAGPLAEAPSSMTEYRGPVGDELPAHLYPFGRTHLNVRRLFALWQGQEEADLPGAYAWLGMELEGRLHSGADDAANIGRLLLSMVRVLRMGRE